MTRDQADRLDHLERLYPNLVLEQDAVIAHLNCDDRTVVIDGDGHVSDLRPTPVAA